ncbi:MAG: tetratricopeptide repeat protein [Cyanobacteria bacterium J06627_28]
MKLGRLVALTFCLVSLPAVGIKAQERHPLDEISSETIIAQADIASLIAQGFEQLSQGNYQAAIQSANQALQIDSQSGEAYIVRSRAQEKLGNTSAAIQDATEAIRLLPAGDNKARALYDRALSYSTIREISNGIGDLTAALNTASTNNRELKSLIYFLRGFLRSESNQAIEAIDDFTEALALRPDYLEAYVQRGLTIEGYLGDRVTAIPDYLAAVQLDPNNSPEAHWNRGQAYMALNNLQAANADYDTAIALDDQYIRPYVSRAVIRSAQLDVEGFRFGYEEANAIKPDDWSIPFLVANAAREYADAIVSSSSATPENRDTATELYDDAMTQLNRAIDQYPNNPFLYSSRGNVLLSTSRPVTALADFSKALSLEPNYALAYYLRGRSHAENRNQRGALADFDRALQSSPNFIDAYLYRGAIKISLGEPGGESDIEQAITLINEIIQLNPNDIAAYSQLSMANSVLGNTTAADTARQQALQLSQRQGNALAAATIQNAIDAEEWQTTVIPPLIEDFGELVAGGPTLDDNSLYQIHTFEGRANQQMMIAMVSPDFDTYLSLIGPDGEQIGFNDDISENITNSYISATLPSSGTYAVVANAYDESGAGNYELSVNAHSGNGFILQTSGTLDVNELTLTDGSAYNTYFFEGRNGQSITIDMASNEFDTYLILRGPDNTTIASSDDISASNTNSQITTILPSDGMYTVWANGYDANAQGQYSISVK